MASRILLAAVAAPFLAGLLAVPPAWSADAPAEPAATQPATPPKTPAHTVKRGTISVDIQTDATLLPADAFEVKLKGRAYGGPFSVVSAAGHLASVKKGESLLVLEDTNYKWMIVQVENELTAARSALRKVEKDQQIAKEAEALALAQQEEAFKNTENSVKWWETVEGPQTLMMSDLQLQSAKFSLEDQEDELDQLRKMYKSEELTNATADIVIKRALRRADMAKVNLKVYQDRNTRLKTYEYPNMDRRMQESLITARHSLANLKSAQEHGAVLRKNTLSAAHIAVEQAERKFSDLKADSGLFSFKAPFDGIVVYHQLPEGTGSDRVLKPDDKIAAGATVMQLVAPGKLRLEISLNEMQAFWVRQGAKARITAAAMPHVVYEGTCGAPLAAPRAQPPGFGFVLPIGIEKVDARLLPGMKANVKVEAGRVESVIVIPIDHLSGGQVTVRLKDGKTERRDVTVGQSDGKLVEIRSGLKEGDQIVPQDKK